MSQLDTSTILKRSDLAWSEKDAWKPVIQEAYEMCYAGMNPYSKGSEKQPRSLDRQFDSTAVTGVIRTGSRILNELTPPDQNWAEVRPGPLLEMQYGKDQLEAIEKQLGDATKLANIVLNSGSSVAARSAAFIDCLIAGFGCILGMEDLNDDTEPLTDQAVSQAEVAYDINGKGRVSGIFRKRRIKIRLIKGVWGDAKLPEGLPENSGKDKDPEIEVLEATYEGGPNSKVRWYYEVLYCRDGKDPVRMVERKYDTCPWTILRWMVLPGVAYAPGPVLMALADIRTANKVMEMILKNAALALAGMYLVRDDGVVNPDNISITPGGLLIAITIWTRINDRKRGVN